MLRHFKYSGSVILSCLLFAACVTLTGCSNGDNTVVEGELTAEQEAERDEVTMPGAPSEEGDATTEGTDGQ